MELLQLKENIYDATFKFEHCLQNYMLTTENITDSLQKLPSHIINVMDKCKDYCDQMNVSKREYFSIVTYLGNYYVIYDFFKSVVLQCENDKVLNEMQHCVFSEFISLSQNINAVFKGNDNIGSFINLMDVCLEKIQEIDITKGLLNANNALENSKQIIEEILLFAMSVAQVGYNDDNKIITAGCRTVLCNLDNVKEEINKSVPNLSMCNLVVEMYTNSLCALEAKVNITVLNLCLQVFTSYKPHIEDVYKACLNANSEDWQVLVPGFDVFMDRIFQIGSFSLACSSINKRTADLKIVTSNLQFLEKELIPSFIALSVDNSPHSIQYANICKKCWCVQVKKLRSIVHNIIEPEAYCKIIYEELKHNTEKLWDHISSGTIVKETMIDPFLSYTNELGKMIKTSINSIIKNNDVLIKLKLMYNILHELTVAKNRLLEETSVFTPEEVNQKIFKRCKILLAAIKELWICLKGDCPEVSNEDSYALSIESDPNESCATGALLESLIDKSRQLIRSRVMHTTIAISPTCKTYSKKNYNDVQTVSKVTEVKIPLGSYFIHI